MNGKELNAGDTVWAKMKGFCPWPALVCVPHGKMSPKPKRFQHLVFFLGTHDFARVLDKDIFLNTDERLQSSKLSPKKSSTWSLAIEEIQNSKLQTKFRTSIAWKLKQEEHCKKPMKIVQESIKKAKKVNHKIKIGMKKIETHEIASKEIAMKVIEIKGSEPMENKPIENIANKAMEREPLEMEPMEREPLEMEPMEREPLEMEPMERGPLEMEPMEREPLEMEPMERLPLEMEPMEREPLEMEPMAMDIKTIQMKKMNKIQKKHNKSTKMCLKKQSSSSTKTTSVLEHNEIVTNHSQPVMKKWCLSLYTLMKKMIRPLGMASLESLPTNLYSKVTQLYMSMNAMQQQFSFNSLPNKGKQLFLKCLAKLKAQRRREQMLEPALNLDSVSE